VGIHWNGAPIQIAVINYDFDSVAVWASQRKSPIFFHEFSAYSERDQDGHIHQGHIDTLRALIPIP
jgi:hypothetical protein